MAIAYRASGTFVAANSTSSGAIGLPAGLANGDTMILPVQARGGGTVTTPSGYTRGAEVNITKGHRLVVFYKYVTNAAGEAAPSVTQSASGLICGRISAFSGCDSTTQLDVTPVTNKHSDLATVTASSVSPVSPAAMAVWIFSSGDDNTLNAATQGTTAYSSDTTTGADGSLALVYELQTNAGAVGTCAMTESANSPDNWNTVTIALRPSVSAAADPSRTLGFDSITYALEMAFGASPFAPSPVWTDVSAYVRADQGLVVTRGRQSEFSETSPGTMSFTLDNRLRLFDPAYASGAYFGQLVPQTRCRLRVRKSSVNYPIFDGYIQAWPQSYLYPREAVVQINAVDLMSRLATRKIPPTLLALNVLSDGADAYWMFDESADSLGTGIAADASGHGHASGFNTMLEVDTILSGEVGRKAKRVVSPADERFNAVPFGAQGDSLTLLRTMELWVQADAFNILNGITPTLTFTGYSNNSVFELSLTATITGPKLVVTCYDAGLVGRGTITRSISLADPMHLVCVLDSTATTFTVYWNGQVFGTVDVSAGTFDSGALAGVFGIVAIGAVDATFAHVALYEEDLSATQVSAHYDAGTTGGKLQTPAARLEALADYCGLVDAGLFADTNLPSASHLGIASFSGSALSAMQSVMVTEQGRLFASSAGVLQAQGRCADMKTLAVNAVSQATLSDSGTLAYVEVPIDSSALELMRNAIYLSTTTGTTVAVIDSDSRDLYDELEESITTELSDPTAANNLGLSRLRRFADPTTRVNSVRLLPHGASDVRYPVALGVELGWRVTVTRTPQALGSAISLICTVEGITHSVSERGPWTTTLYLVPAQTAYTVQPWFTMGDATYGRLGIAAGNQLPY